MNNAKLWLVVQPTVGVPIFLGAVAVGSFAVHVAVLTNTTWVSDFLSGQPLGAGSTTAALATEGTVNLTAAEAIPGEAILITMPDGSTVRAIIEPSTTLASLGAPEALPTQ